MGYQYLNKFLRQFFAAWVKKLYSVGAWSLKKKSKLLLYKSVKKHNKQDEHLKILEITYLFY